MATPPLPPFPPPRPRPVALALLAAAALAACSTTPAYRAPEPGERASAPFDAAASAPGTDATREPPDHWWRLYDAPALDALVQEALAHNRDLAVAAANVRHARALLAEADAARLPSTTTTLGVDVGQHASDQVVDAARGSGDAATRVGWSAGFAVSWEADLWGRVANLVDAGRADAETREAAADALRVSVAAETAAAWTRACSYGERIDVARHSLELARRLSTLLARQEAAGAVAPRDAANARALADDAEARLPALEAERRAALYELAVLAGRAPADVPDAALQCHAAPLMTRAFPVGDGAALLRRRPDLREAERRLAAAHARLGAAQASLYPDIVLGASVAGLSASGDPGSLGDRNTLAWGIGPLIQWRFPNLATARAQADAAGADEDGARAAFESRVLLALRETEQALARYGGAWREHDALGAARAGHARALALAEREFDAGALEPRDLLESERDAVAADAALAQSTQRLALDQVAVFKALGGGWQP